MKQNTFLDVESTYGTLKVSRENGFVTSCSCSRDTDYINKIIWFDLDDYYEALPELDRQTDCGIDICNLNFVSLVDGKLEFENAAEGWLANLRFAQSD